MADPSLPAEDRPPAGLRVGRRVVLIGGSAAVATALGGCGVRLQDDAPDLPLIPRRVKLPGESSLLDLLGDTVTLARTARSGSSDLAQQLAALHSVQARVLHDRLLALGVPSALVDTASRGKTASPGASSAAATPPVTDPALAAAELRAVAGADAHAGTSADVGVLVLALLAQRFAAGELLAPGTVDSGPTPGVASSPSPSPSSPATAAPNAAPTAAAAPATAGLLLVGPQALTRLEEIAYLLQVIGPHAAPAEKALADQMSLWLTPVIERAHHSLATKNPPAVLGVPHPLPIDDPTAQRAALARATGAAISASGTDLVALARSSLRQALGVVPAHLGTLVVWSYRWGAPLTALPGLRTP